MGGNLIPIRLTLMHGGILSLAASIFLLLVMRFNPRLFLQDYPQEIQDAVPAKTEVEKRQSLWVGIPFLLLFIAYPLLSTWQIEAGSGRQLSFFSLWIHAFGIVFFFNLVDLIILDWLMFCTITPKFMVDPGTEQMPAYRDYGFHFRGSLTGTFLSLLAGLAVAGIVTMF